MQIFSHRSRGVRARARAFFIPDFNFRLSPVRRVIRTVALLAAGWSSIAMASAAQITLGWLDNSDNESGFQLERATDAVNFVPIATVAANVTMFADTAVGPATTYWFRVRAYNANGNSSFSNVSTFTTPPVVSVNTAPTIGAIAGRTMAEDGSTGAIAFSVADSETAAGSLIVTATSSNTALVPNVRLVLGGSGGSRTLTITGAANQSGSATITLNVSDGALTATRSFVLTVTAVNDLPTISVIANRTISPGSSTGAVAFTVGDVETAAASLTVTGKTSNATLVPVARIVLGGSGANRTVTVTPVINQTGTATITLNVRDGAASSNRVFVLTVTSLSSAPTISAVSNRTIPEDASTGAIGFTVGDAQTAAGALVVTATSSNTALVPNSSIVLGGSGANRTVTVTTLANKSGVTTITLSVSNGALSATRTFSLTVTAVNDLPTIISMAGLTIPVGTATGPIACTVSDIETPAGSLVLSAASSNALLVPVGNITFAGSGANRTMTIAPVAAQSGAAAITVNVSDGTAVVGRTFMLTVSSIGPVLVPGDIGSPALAGSTSLTDGVYVMSAGGDDIWFQRDQFHFASQQITGDAEITVRVASLTQAHVWTKAGLMFRGALTADAPFVTVLVTPENGINFQWRSQTGANAQSGTALPGVAPEWLKLVRTGDDFYAFRSDDGVTWELVEFVSVDLPDVAFGGLAATSHNTLARTTVTFDNLEID